MKSYDKLMASVIAIMLAVFAAGIILINAPRKSDSLYKVEISRIEHAIANSDDISLNSFDTISGVYEYNGEADFYYSPNKYVIRKINGRLYRIEYDDADDKSMKQRCMIISFAFAILFVAVFCVLFHIRQRIISPFNEISGFPHELAKGNLTLPLKENKSRYFGKFIWGLDMLREELEHSRQQRLDKIKAEKTFLLSLSHDIKTPLSAIKLYSKALSKGLYSDSKKQLEIAENIDQKADEIERYVNEIIKNSDEDFMTFDVVRSEFYMSQVIDDITGRYEETLSAVGTAFKVNAHYDCLLSGDADRLAEVLQNIIENAVKYGDGHSISISFFDEEDCRLITVTNSGCTLPDTELTHIFDSFWRGSNTGNKPGSGLGLYICRRLMNAMDGDIFAEISDGNMSVTAVCRKSA